MREATLRPAPRRTGRTLRALGFGLAGLLLIALFLLLAFPSGLLRGRAERALERATGADVAMRSLRAGLGWGGPQVHIEDLVVHWSGHLPLRLAKLDLRPVWTKAWLGGPAWGIRFSDAEVGRLDATAELGDERRVQGELRDFGLEQLLRFSTVWQMQGELDADFDVAERDGELVGSASLRARDGQLRIPKLAAPVPFETLEAWLLFGGEAFAHIESLELRGPLARMDLAGRLGHAPLLERAPLALEGSVYVAERGVRGALATHGLAFGPDGHARFRIHGTLAAPILEP